MICNPRKPPSVYFAGEFMKIGQIVTYEKKSSYFDYNLMSDVTVMEGSQRATVINFDEETVVLSDEGDSKIFSLPRSQVRE
jgi:hypothetical protein